VKISRRSFLGGIMAGAMAALVGSKAEPVETKWKSTKGYKILNDGPVGVQTTEEY